MADQNRVPTSNGSFSQMLSLSGGANYLEVDDPVGSPDDESSYLYRDGSFARTQQFGFTAFDINASSISKVTVTVRARYSAGTAPSFAGLLYIGGLQYLASAQAVASSYTNYTFEWATNPSTFAAWTESQVEALTEFGFRRTGGDGSTQTRVTQAYITVEYTERQRGQDTFPLLICNLSLTCRSNRGFDQLGRKTRMMILWKRMK